MYREQGEAPCSGRPPCTTIRAPETLVSCEVPGAPGSGAPTPLTTLVGRDALGKVLPSPSTVRSADATPDQTTADGNVPNRTPCGTPVRDQRSDSDLAAKRPPALAGGIAEASKDVPPREFRLGKAPRPRNPRGREARVERSADRILLRQTECCNLGSPDRGKCPPLTGKTQDRAPT